MKKVRKFAVVIFALAVIFLVCWVAIKSTRVKDSSYIIETKEEVDGMKMRMSRHASPIERADAQYVQGWYYYDKEDYDEAVKFFQMSITIDPNFAWGYKAMSDCYQKTDRLGFAMKALDIAIGLNPQEERFRIERYNVAGELRWHESQVEDAEALIRLYPDRGLYRLWLSYAYSNDEKHDEALEVCQSMLSGQFADVHRGEVVIRLARIYRYSGRWTDVLQTLEQHEKTDELAWALATGPKEIRDGRRALALATLVCEKSEWEDDFDLDVLAAAYAENGDFENAVKYQKEALNITKGHVCMGLTTRRADTDFAERLQLYESGKPFRMKGVE